MVKELMHDPIFLGGKSKVATIEDLQNAQIIQHEIDHCNGVLI